MFVTSPTPNVTVMFVLSFKLHGPLCMCVCYWPPVCGVCSNYEVVEFQPRKVTPPKPHRPLNGGLIYMLIYLSEILDLQIYLSYSIQV